MHLQQPVNSTSKTASLLGIYDLSSPGEGDHFHNPKNIHPPYQAVILCQHSNTPVVDIWVVLSFITLTVILYRSFLPRPHLSSARHLSIRNPNNFPLPVFSFHSTYWFSRSRVLDRYHIGAYNLKSVFSRVCSDMYHPRKSSNNLWWVWSTVNQFLSITN